MESILVFDTETISTNKPFCYNVGYVIFNPASGETLKTVDFIIEQIWHNPALFETAYYAGKRPIYVSAMRGRKAVMKKWGYAMRALMADIKNYNVIAAYAFNSPFDDRVFSFNCDWYKTVNPFDNIPIYDVRAYAHNFICNKVKYFNWAESQNQFTEAGNYSTTAESIFRYITGNNDFIEDHTALSDSLVELEILRNCIDSGAEWNKEYQVKTSFPRQKFTKIYLNKKYLTTVRYSKMTVSKDKSEINFTE